MPATIPAAATTRSATISRIRFRGDTGGHGIRK
jgi:hypothetical protein